MGKLEYEARGYGGSRVNMGERSLRVDDHPDSHGSHGDISPDEDCHIGELACNAVTSGWWSRFDLPYGDYVGLESDAISIRDFDPGVFPGLLQAPDYAQALHERAEPRLSKKLIEERIETRRIRQRVLLRDHPPTLHAIVDEAVLHRVVGSPKVMADQLAHVIKASAQDNVIVQVLPYRVGAHPALDSPFILLEFASPRAGVVYVEDLIRNDYRDDPAHVRRYTRVHGTLARLAYSACASIVLLEDIRTKYEQE